jgi:RNA polymerase sigma-70 factor, ECF subfamily
MPVTTDVEATLRELLAIRSPATYDRATTLALESYGPELVGWLCASLPESDAHDAFGALAEELWKSLPGFDGRCSVRTWCYMLARAARFRIHASAARRHEQLVSQIPSVAHAVTHVWNTTRRVAAQQQDVYAQIRGELDDEDQVLLVLRVDKDLPWQDIALVLLGPTAAADEVGRKAATLRKQFEIATQLFASHRTGCSTPPCRWSSWIASASSCAPSRTTTKPLKASSSTRCRAAARS